MGNCKELFVPVSEMTLTTHRHILSNVNKIRNK